MDYRIIEKPAFDVSGQSQEIHHGERGKFQKNPAVLG